MVTFAIIGSRNFQQPDKVKETIDFLYKEFKENLKIITGGAEGVDTTARTHCQTIGIPCQIIRPIKQGPIKDYHGNFTYLFRNIEIITKAHKVFAFWDGSSRGTHFTIEYARARGKLQRVIQEENGQKNIQEFG